MGNNLPAEGVEAPCVLRGGGGGGTERAGGGDCSRECCGWGHVFVSFESSCVSWFVSDIHVCWGTNSSVGVSVVISRDSFAAVTARIDVSIFLVPPRRRVFRCTVLYAGLLDPSDVFP